MSTRVLATDEAKAAITQMQAIINGELSDTLTQLSTQGDILSQPDVWDGVLATQFRGDLWPQTKTACTNMKTALEELRVQCEQINRNIMAAGGNA